MEGKKKKKVKTKNIGLYRQLNLRVQFFFVHCNDSIFPIENSAKLFRINYNFF